MAIPQGSEVPELNQSRIFDGNKDFEQLLLEATPGEWRVEQGPTHLHIRAPHQEKRSIAVVYCDIDARLICLLKNLADEIRRKESG